MGGGNPAQTGGGARGAAAPHAVATIAASHTSARCAPAEMSDRGRAQHFAPMRNPLLERALASVGQLLEIDLLENLEGETLRPVRIPRGLKRLVRLNALPQRERAAGPDRGKIGRRADPLLAGRRAADRIDPGNSFALLIGRDGGLAFGSVHIATPNASSARRDSCSRRASIDGSARR